MIFNPEKLDSKELERRKRFWDKKGFFGTPTKKQLESSSKRMQKLLVAIQNLTIAEINKLRKNRWSVTTRLGRAGDDAIISATESDLRYALTIAPKDIQV